MRFLLGPFVKSGSTNCCINCETQALTNSTLRVVASNVLSLLGTTFGSGQLEKIPLVLEDPSLLEELDGSLQEFTIYPHVTVEKANSERTLKSGDYFGESSIL